MCRIKLVIAFTFCFFLCACSEDEERSPQPVAAATSIPLPVYRVVSDDYLSTFKRTVEVQLPERTSVESLKLVAEKIKIAATRKTDRTFIIYRVGASSESGYWATTHYDPDLKIVVLGMTEDYYSQVVHLDLSNDYPALVGSWISEGDGLSHLMVIYKANGKLFLDSVHEGNEKFTHRIMAAKARNGALKIKDPDMRNEFYVLTKSGDLQFWNEDGIFKTLLPRAPSEINLTIAR